VGASSLDGEALREVMSRFAQSLREHRDELDSLNVYPVPDGDTGTNLLLTQEAVHAALDGGPESLAELGEAIPRAALLGARGNSGVILAQALRGLCGKLSGSGNAPTGAELAAGLGAAAEEARLAVARPVEGTVLTVLADAARAAEVAARDRGGDASAADVARAAHLAARGSLAGTPDQLPELREAGVVDAGGKGIVLLLDALRSVLTGEAPAEDVGPLGPVGIAGGSPATAPPGSGQRYEVVYLLDAPDDRVAALRGRLAGMGDSLVVVGGGGSFKVHLHTDDPGPAIEEALDAGRPRQIQVADLESQVAERCIAGEARAVRGRQRPAGLIAVVDGDGLADILRELGAIPVPAAPGRVPSAERFAEAIAAVDALETVVLASHPEVVRAAEEAASAANVPALVVRVASVPAAMAAAAVFDPSSPAHENARAMRDAAEVCTAGEVIREAGDGMHAVAGEEVVATGDDLPEMAMRLVEALRTDAHELLTVYVGRAVAAGEADRVVAALRDAVDLELEVHRGGQAADLLVGLE
jgi:DAK2 domain fusion protein YloV